MTETAEATPAEEDVISAGEAARMLGVSIDTMRRYTGLRTWTTPGGHRRYLRAEIAALRDNRTATT